MHLDPYRRVLSLPGVRAVMLLALLSRIPVTAVGVTMTLHVAQDLHRGWGAAGLVGAALTVGTALGGPLNGWFIDRRGLRPMLLATTVCEAVFWVAAPTLSYPALLVGALIAGVFSLPVFSVVRQSLAALVPVAQRRQAFALDSMSVELSFMAGPPLAVILMSSASAGVALWAIGGAIVAAGIALFVVNPPVKPAADDATDPSGAAPGGPAAPLRRRDWLTPRFVAVCAATAATTIVLAGTDLGIVAIMRGADRVQLVGVVLAAWGVYSLLGGFVYGALTRTVPLVALLGGLSLFTLPVGLIGDRWPLLFVALIPAGALCAPTLSAGADQVSRLVPAAARGEALGWHGSSLTVGLAIGSPLAGWAIDRGSPAWGFAAVGAVGVAVTATLLRLQRSTNRADDAEATPARTTGPVTPESETDAAQTGTARTGTARTSAVQTDGGQSDGGQSDGRQLDGGPGSGGNLVEGNLIGGAGPAGGGPGGTALALSAAAGGHHAVTTDPAPGRTDR